MQTALIAAGFEDDMRLSDEAAKPLHLWQTVEVAATDVDLPVEVGAVDAPPVAPGAWVFLDYNQNAKDRTVASAWSVRPTPDARVSMPLEWDEVANCDPAAFTLATAPARVAERGDASAGIDSAAGSSTHSSSCLHRKRLQASETRRGRRTIRSNVTSRRASRRHDGRLRARLRASTVSLTGSLIWVN
jgi:hypothetical protein